MIPPADDQPAKLLTPDAYRGFLVRFLERGGKFGDDFDLDADCERHSRNYEAWSRSLRSPSTEERDEP